MRALLLALVVLNALCAVMEMHIGHYYMLPVSIAGFAAATIALLSYERMR